MFNWRTHVTKTFDKIKLKSQPNTPEIQRLSLSLIKKKHFYWDSEITIFISIAKMYISSGFALSHKSGISNLELRQQGRFYIGTHHPFMGSKS